MDVRRYSIVSSGNDWIIDDGGKLDATSYALRSDAIAAARNFALFHWRHTGQPATVQMVTSRNDATWIPDAWFGRR